MKASEEYVLSEDNSTTETVSKNWFFKDHELTNIPFKKRTLKEKLKVIRFYLIMGSFGGMIALVADGLERQRISKLKYKYFKPTITESALGKSITWEERPVPLTDEELNEKFF